MTHEIECRVALDRVNVARNNGAARKIFIARVSELLSEYEQGRGATACLEDIKAAYMKVAKSLKAARGGKVDG